MFHAQKVALVGATGVLGTEVLSVLEERGWSFDELRLFASGESAGELYSYGGEEIEVEELTDHQILKGFDVVYLCTPAQMTRELLGQVNFDSQLVIDVGGIGSAGKVGDLLIPDAQLSSDSLISRSGYRCNPNPITTLLAPILSRIHLNSKIKAIVASTYQAVSEAGKVALDELWDQTRSVFTQKAASQDAFHHQIAFNCIPQVETILEDGSTRAESRIAAELRTLLKESELPISITCVRVPVFHSHSISLHLELDRALDREGLLSLLGEVSFIRCEEHPEDFPMPLDTTTKDEIFVGRLRANQAGNRPTLDLWIVGDNLRRGAAINAVQILELSLLSDAPE